VSLDEATPCGGTVVIDASVRLRSDQDVSAIAHLDEDGNPTISTFVNDARAGRRGFSTLYVRHTANAPTVDVTLGTRWNTPAAVFSGVSNGQGGGVSVASGRWFATIFPNLAESRVAGPVKLRLQPGTATEVYAVGTLANGTFDLIANTFTLGE
jgi:hypothetical protein